MLENKLEQKRLNCLFLMLLIYPIYNLILVIKQKIGLSFLDNNLMIALYVFVLVYAVTIILRAPVFKRSLLIIFLIYMAIFLLYIVSNPLVKSEFYSTYNWIIYIYFIPISVFVISRIDNWFDLFNNKKYIIISDVILLISFVSKVFFDDDTDYMAFAYDILPFTCIILICAVKYKQKIQWIFSLISLFALGVYGARGALLAFLICGVSIFLLDIYYSGNTKIFINRIIICIGIVVLLCIGVELILPKLVNSSLIESSYVLKRISMGMLSESNAREQIIKSCLEAIYGMGLNINGLYYDRLILPNGLYSHNFILESLLSLGWIFGTCFLIWIFRCLINGFISQSQNGKCVFIFIVSSLFLRYFLSGSIFGEGKFILFMASLMSINKYHVLDNSEEKLSMLAKKSLSKLEGKYE